MNIEYGKIYALQRSVVPQGYIVPKKIATAREPYSLWQNIVYVSSTRKY